VFSETRDHVERKIAALELWIGIEHKGNVDGIGNAAEIGFDLSILQRKIGFQYRQNAVRTKGLICFRLLNGFGRGG
jgi:hypothetical protein